MTRVTGALPLVISLLALGLSLVGLLYTARTYAVLHRPYIGIVDMPFQLVENPPRGMIWKVVLKNVGSIPGFLTIEENSASLTTPAGVTGLPALGGLTDAGTMVMPGQTTELPGAYTEVGNQIPFNDILTGTATLKLTVRLSYKFPGWLWRRSAFYRAVVRFQVVKGFAPAFVMLSAEAD